MSKKIEYEKHNGDLDHEKAVDVQVAPAYDEDGPVEFAEKADLRYAVDLLAVLHQG